VPWVIHANSDVGARDEQQDRYLIAHSDDGASQLLVVADGAGGEKMGALAAQTAVDYIAQKMDALWQCDDPTSFIETLINECNDRVLSVGGSELACSTLVLAFARGDELYWGHVGDSRFYLIRDSQVVSQTKDHSLEELEQSQEIQKTAENSKSSANGLYMCLGALQTISPEVASSILRADDSLILCSDGLWGQLDMKPVIFELSQNPLNETQVILWTELAKKNKLDRSDNITIIAAKYVKKTNAAARLAKSIAKLFSSRK